MLKKLKAFTLSEILITLSIIGIVAAITIPNLITYYHKKSTETKVLKFYSNMQNAIRLSIVNNGPYEDWIFDNKILNTDGFSSYEQQKKYLEKYILPYLNYEKIEKYKEDSVEKLVIKLEDGSVIRFTDQSGKSWNTDILMFYILCIDGDMENRSSRNMFSFISDKTHYIKPFDFQWNNDRNKLLNDTTWGCKMGRYERKNPQYCTKLLQLNNWKFPKDYPW